MAANHLTIRPAAARLSSADVTSLGITVSRYGLIIVLALIGLSKFTAGEAAGIKPFIEHSPFLAWTYLIASPQTVSNVLGVTELVTAGLLIARPFSPNAAALGAVFAILTFITTLTFLLTTPGAFAFAGLAILGDAGGFLIKDVVLLGASIVVLGDALAAKAPQQAA